MPFIEPRDDGAVLHVDCMCGHRSNNYDAHYRHIPDCELHRCQHCLTVLRGGPITDERFDTASEHFCPHVERQAKP